MPGTPSCTPTHPSERVTPVWSFELLQDFLTRKQLCSSLPSNREDVCTKASCRTFGQRQGHAGGVIAGTRWELPVGSCITTGWRSLSCGRGVPQPGAQCTHRLTAPCARWSSGQEPCAEASPRLGLLQKLSQPAAPHVVPAPEGDLRQHRGTADPLHATTSRANYSAFVCRAASGGNYGSGVWANPLPPVVRSPSSQHIFQQTLPGRFKIPLNKQKLNANSVLSKPCTSLSGCS